jgi:hypothetical protein
MTYTTVFQETKEETFEILDASMAFRCEVPDFFEIPNQQLGNLFQDCAIATTLFLSLKK